MKAFPLKILSMKEELYNGKCTSLTVPLPDGLYGIMAGHSDILSILTSGKITCKCPGNVNKAFEITDGTLKIKDGEVTIVL